MKGGAEEVLRLLIGEGSPNDAEIFISVLRNAGHAVRATRVEAAGELQEALDSKPFDLFLCSAHLEALGLEEAYQMIRQRGLDIPLVAVSEEEDQERRRQVLEIGGEDMVLKHDLEHLRLVVEREARHVAERRRLRRLESTQREMEKRTRGLLDSSREAVAYVHEGMHIYANPAYLQIFGFADAADIEGIPLLDLVVGDDQAACKEALRKFRGEEVSEHEARLRIQPGEGERREVILRLTHATYDEEPCTQVVVQELGEDRSAQEQIERLARHDALTGLYNRGHFLDLLDSTIARGAESGGPPSHAVLYVRLEGLGRVRQRIGISGVDHVLKDLAGTVREAVEGRGTAARFADEAFAVLVPHTSVEDAQLLGEELRGRIEAHVSETPGGSVAVTGSIGVSMAGSGTKGAEEAIEQALEAADAAAKQGGNTVHLRSGGESGPDPAVESSEWHERLTKALEQDGFFLVYQPVVGLNEGDEFQESYEVRVRLGEPGGDEHTAPEFLPYAEQAGLMPKIDCWVVREAVRILARGLRKGPQRRLFLKVSGETLAYDGFLAYVEKALQRSQVPPAALVFQVNEPVVVTRMSQAKALQQGLRQLGCKLALDHFGSALNPFQLLKQLPADLVKLDRTLTGDIDENSENQELVRRILETAHQMDQRVIGGYVESASVLATLWGFGVDYVSGAFLQGPSYKMDYDFSEMVM